MSHGLWLGLSLVVSAAQAQHLNVGAQLTAPNARTSFELTAPCLGCRAALRAATQGYAPEPSPPVPAARTLSPVKKPQYAIGDSWTFAGGRTLSVRLTPTPEECAPLVSLSF